MDIAKTPEQMNRYMVAENCYSSNSHEDSDNDRKSTNESSLCSLFISFNSNGTLKPQLKERNQKKVMILTILDKIVSNAMKVSSAKDLKIEKHDIINNPFNKNFHKSNRDNYFSTTVTYHDIPISSKKTIVGSNIIKCSNDHIILTTEGWEENDVISSINHETSTPSNTYSPPRHILHHHNDSTSQGTLINIRQAKILPPSIRYSLRSSALSPSQKQRQQRSRDIMVDSFYSSTIKPHFSHQNNNIKRRHNTLRNSSTCISTIKTQQNSSTPSRGRGKFRSSPHHRNNLRNTNSISPTAYQSQLNIPLVIPPININTDTDKKQYSNPNTRPPSSVSNPHSQPNFYVDLHLVIILVVLPDYDPVHNHFLVPLLYHLHHLSLISYL